MFPNIRLPAQPIITRWGTWLEAEIYYAEHFDKIVQFLGKLDPTEANHISEAQTAINQRAIKNELKFIKRHFSSIPVAIKQLEAKNLSLGIAIRTFKSVQSRFEHIPNRREFLERFKYISNKNK